MIVCHCRLSSHADIARAISDGATTVDEVGDRCGAGTGCGLCRNYIRKQLGQASVAQEAPTLIAHVLRCL